MKNQGFSLVEVTMVLGIMAAAGAAMMTFMNNQSKSGNRMEYVTQREQLRSTITVQFLSSPQSCKCLFQGATFNRVGITDEIDFTEGVIGRRHFTTPGNCATSTVPFKLAGINEVINGLRATEIKLKNIQEVSGSYMANFHVKVDTPKSMVGSKESQIVIPVVLATAPHSDPNRLQLDGCSLGGSSAGSTMPKCRLVYEIFEHNGCNGKSAIRHSDWTDEGTPGEIKWTHRDAAVLYYNKDAVGAPVATRSGRNYITADVSCSRVGIQCI